MANLDGLRVATLVTDGFEESELTEPVKALRDAGAKVDLASLEKGKIQAFRHHDKSIQVDVDRRLKEIQPGEYDAVLLPGGALNADRLRIEEPAQRFVRGMLDEGKPVAVICHGPWLLVSAGVARGRKLTSYHTIRDDLRNAGADWVDQEVVVDGQLVSSRSPKDLPAFNREMIRVFGEFLGKRKGKAA